MWKRQNKTYNKFNKIRVLWGVWLLRHYIALQLLAIATSAAAGNCLRSEIASACERVYEIDFPATQQQQQHNTLFLFLSCC